MFGFGELLTREVLFLCQFSLAQRKANCRADVFLTADMDGVIVRFNNVFANR